MPLLRNSALGNRRPSGTIALLAASVLVLSALAHAQTFSVLHAFTNRADGGSPYTGVSMDRAGNLYGTTSSGGDGPNPSGTIYRLKRVGSTWILSTLYSDNYRLGEGGPYDGGVIVGPDGNVYGMTEIGGTNCAPRGCGTVYQLRPPAAICRATSCPWTKTILYSFGGTPDGANPNIGNLTFDRAGNLYGVTGGGGAYNNGTVFKLTRSGNSWTESVLWSFAGNSDGVAPTGTLVFDSAGNLYGTATGGGANSAGTVFELSPSQSGWTETTLYSLDQNEEGYEPFGGVALDQHGNIFGATFEGGPHGGGTAFGLTPSSGGWTSTLLASFSGYEGPFDAPSVDPAGNVYLTNTVVGIGGGSVVYRFTYGNGSWNSTALHTFSGGDDGSVPAASVLIDGTGNLYSTAIAGGHYGQGVVFEITP